MVVSVDLAGLLPRTRQRRASLRFLPRGAGADGRGTPLWRGRPSTHPRPCRERSRIGSRLWTVMLLRTVNRVAAQQIAQEWHLHRRTLHVVVDRLGEIPGSDAVVPRVMEPVRLRESVRQRGLAYARHAQQRDGLVLPPHELGPGHLHGVACSPVFRCLGANRKAYPTGRAVCHISAIHETCDPRGRGPRIMANQAIRSSGSAAGRRGPHRRAESTTRQEPAAGRARPRAVLPERGSGDDRAERCAEHGGPGVARACAAGRLDVGKCPSPAHAQMDDQSRCTMSMQH